MLTFTDIAFKFTNSEWQKKKNVFNKSTPLQCFNIEEPVTQPDLCYNSKAYQVTAGSSEELKTTVWREPIEKREQGDLGRFDDNVP